ncbi:MAG: transposase [Nitrospira sp.]|nr:transposase [Nitrospira sp.]MBS0165577.1 transposase [Nitrospira sp.]
MEGDHVQPHMVISPKYAVSRVVEILKSVTSRQLNEKSPHVLCNAY